MIPREEKALEILKALALKAADGKALTIAADWGYGSATVIDQDGAHTHIGCDSHENEQISLDAFIDGLHDLLVCGRGLSFVKKAGEVKSNSCGGMEQSSFFADTRLDG